MTATGGRKPTERVAHYTSLRPREYRFEVTAANHHGVWSPTPASFSFSIAPHFYDTWPFYTLCGLGAFGLAAGSPNVPFTLAAAAVEIGRTARPGQ